MLPVTVLTPYLSSLWLKYVTPLYVRIGKALIEGIRNPTVVKDSSALTTFSVKPQTISEAMRRSLQAEEDEIEHFRGSELYSNETITYQKKTADRVRGLLNHMP